MTMIDLNPVTAEILRNKFDAIVAEMRATLTSTAYSPMIGEAKECCSAIFTENTSLVAIDSPVHLFSMADTAAAVIDRFQYDLGADDIILTNDPYCGGGRVQEFTLIAPVSHQEEIILYLGVRGHIEDFAGDLRGNLNPKATEIWQEGARCTPVRLFKDGRMVQDALSTILLNSRSPEALRLDLEAMAAAITVGKRRFAELIHNHGVELLLTAMNWTIDYAERRLTSLFEQWPAGEYQGEAVLPHDCHSRNNLKIRTTLRVNDGKVQLDLSQSDPQSAGFVNATRSMASGYALLPILTALGAAVPRNSGITRCVEIVTKKGTLVDPSYPAPTGWSVDHVGYEISQSVSAALSQFIPNDTASVIANRMLAFTVERGIRHGFTIEQLDTYDYSRFAQGGCSGAWECDGWGMPAASAVAPLPSVELYETRGKGQIKSLEFLTDSAGPGRWRGGLGTHARLAPVEADDRELHITACVVGLDPSQKGVAGGRPGTSNRLLVVTNENETEVATTLIDVQLSSGAEIVLTMGGGPGWGNAIERDPELVLEDVLNEHVSRQSAKRDYGVVIRGDGTLDLNETAKLRKMALATGDGR